MAQSTDTRLILGARGAGPAGVETIPLDLARLDSVRSFAVAVRDRLGSTEIDALVLNAGVSLTSGDERTADGFETTFAVNHLAHYLLLRLLLPQLADGAVVAITTSGTHDPATRTMLSSTPPRHADARLLANPERDPQRDEQAKAAGGRAYASSKLCNILTVRGLAAQPEASQLRIVAFDPGPTPGTSLLRNTPPAVRLIWRLLGTPIRALVPRFNSVPAAGGALAAIASGRTVPPADAYYARLVQGQLTWLSPSELARRDDVRDRLWRDSAELVGLPVTLQ
ncbi:SDR family NAD(P)-dependent oxidoreductase [Solwaraspora sp. WMMD1047]|uniref:SDR family NAD(P)-dependent oxidoreductase n=1 Tax=Solwaraspora sp. WMMD1047 TaxID=3016102 RepID=UPI0024169024|nr:SDR family NAD(P)-dependent oxidoreductase [Solwaraspora sp. WMMD1047]MDG4831460.1 SDR family NAD(P)-dependent oxidoreductase [Solwaraspora sp. WMMD1047]